MVRTSCQRSDRMPGAPGKRFLQAFGGEIHAAILRTSQKHKKTSIFGSPTGVLPGSSAATLCDQTQELIDLAPDLCYILFHCLSSIGHNLYLSVEQNNLSEANNTEPPMDDFLEDDLLQTVDGLQRLGFDDLYFVRELRDPEDISSVPTDGGIYLVINSMFQTDTPTFLSRGTGGYFKGEDPKCQH